MAKTNGAKLFAEIIQGYGLTHVFYVPQVVSKALVAMEDMNIRRVVAHSEKAAAYMADGYARARGGPGVCMAQPIGASNLASGLRDAFMARSPVIAISGGPAVASRYRHAYQEVEDFEQFDERHEGEFQRRQPGAAAGPAAPGVQDRNVGHAGAGAPALPGPRIGRAARRSRGRCDRRAAVHARAGVSSRARSRTACAKRRACWRRRRSRSSSRAAAS